MIIIFFPSKFNLKIGSPTTDMNEQMAFIESKNHSKFMMAYYKYKIKVTDKSKNNDYYKTNIAIDGVGYEYRLINEEKSLKHIFAAEAKINICNSIVPLKRNKIVKSEMILNDPMHAEKYAVSKYNDSKSETIYKGSEYNKIQSGNYVISIMDYDIRKINGIMYIDDDDCSIFVNDSSTSYIYQYVYEGNVLK